MKINGYVREIREDANAIARHKELLMDYCRKQHMTIDEFFVECMYGDVPLTNRPILQKCIESGLPGDKILILKVDTLSSRTSIVQEIIAACNLKNIEIITTFGERINPLRTATNEAQENGGIDSTSMTPEHFGASLRNLLTEVYGTLKADVGYTEKEIASAEKRLGFTLPSVLRSCYQMAGKHQALCKGHQNLVTPRHLTFPEQRISWPETDIQGLMFMVEQQRVCFSVIPTNHIKEPDPPVYQGNDAEDNLYLEYKHLSLQLLQVVCWNSMELLSSGSAKVVRSVLEKMSAVLSPIDGSKAQQNRFVLHKGPIVAVAEPAAAGSNEFHLFVAAKSRQELRGFEKQMGISLDDTE